LLVAYEKLTTKYFDKTKTKLTKIR